MTNYISKSLLATYLCISVSALILCWYQNWHYIGMGFVDGNLNFWQDTLANPASRSITIDIFFFYFAAAIWMVLEAKKYKIRYVWGYLIMSLLVAVSVFFPLFLIHREIVINKGAR